MVRIAYVLQAVSVYRELVGHMIQSSDYYTPLGCALLMTDGN